MLGEAIFVEENGLTLPKSILNDPSLFGYFNNFGKDIFDICYVAEENNILIATI
ncbi:MAG: hypothetical protein ACJAU2_001300 [Maribacter sp.]|jgi:hypothetical protein